MAQSGSFGAEGQQSTNTSTRTGIITSGSGSGSFLWGAATSSYQVEGNITNNDFNFFNGSPEIKSRINNGANNMQPAGEADRDWNPQYYEKDFDNAKSLGLNAYRFSLEWSRIEPQRGVWDQSAIDHYRQMILEMKAKGLTPIVTLEHFTLPLWVLTPIVNKNCLVNATESNPACKGEAYFSSLRGWESNETVNEYVKYVEYVVPKLKDLVDYWVTINEPVGVYVSLGYVVGMWSPGFIGDGVRAKAALHNLIEAHVKAYDAISRLDDVAADKTGPAKMVGFANAMMDLEPVPPPIANIKRGDLNQNSAVDNSKNIEAAKNANYYTNDYFLNAVIHGEEDLNYLNTLERHNTKSPEFIKHPEWINKLDFVGVNYYRRAYISYDANMERSSFKFLGGAFSNSLPAQPGQSHSSVSDLGWEIYPQGLYDILMHIKNQWDKPIMITENGIADGTDKYRAPYIVSHISEMTRAIEDGAYVLGYMHWSLIDNWELQEGYRSQSEFGLYHVQRNNVTSNSISPVAAGGKSEDGQAGVCGACSRNITTGALAYGYLISQAGYNFDVSSWEKAISSAKGKFGYFSPDGYYLFQPASSVVRTSTFVPTPVQPKATS